MKRHLELGVDTFGDVTEGADGRLLTQPQVLRNVVAEGVLADELGLDFFGVGEHHREDFAVSAPEVVLAAIAGRTSRIRLGSAVTVLSSDDPVRVYERFATLDALSNGRAEILVGRGSFTESFPLFGFPLERYEELFEERLDLLAKLLTERPVTWTGATRAALANQRVFPPTGSGALRTWVGVGGTPQSVVRAARYGLSDDARDHRRESALLRAARRPLSAGARRSGPIRRAAGGRPLARPRRGDGRTGPRGGLAALRGDDDAHRPRARLAPRDPRRSTSAPRVPTARCSSARRRRWRPRSRESPALSTCRASTSSTAWARCRTRS